MKLVLVSMAMSMSLAAVVAHAGVVCKGQVADPVGSLTQINAATCYVGPGTFLNLWYGDTAGATGSSLQSFPLIDSTPIPHYSLRAGRDSRAQGGDLSRIYIAVGNLSPNAWTPSKMTITSTNPAGVTSSSTYNLFCIEVERGGC